MGEGGGVGVGGGGMDKSASAAAIDPFPEVAVQYPQQHPQYLRHPHSAMGTPLLHPSIHPSIHPLCGCAHGSLLMDSQVFSSIFVLFFSRLLIFIRLSRFKISFLLFLRIHPCGCHCLFGFDRLTCVCKNICGCI